MWRFGTPVNRHISSWCPCQELDAISVCHGVSSRSLACKVSCCMYMCACRSMLQHMIQPVFPCLHLQPAGLTTFGKTGNTSPQACDLPAGYFLRGPGVVAACPQGEYKGPGAAATCQKCPNGVTTVREASRSIAACVGGLQACQRQADAMLRQHRCPRAQDAGNHLTHSKGCSEHP